MHACLGGDADLIKGKKHDLRWGAESDRVSTTLHRRIWDRTAHGINSNISGWNKSTLEAFGGLFEPKQVG
ncbi:hypothetical protein BH09ACT6_BH09ACT6_21130 [soil metagenome]